MLADTRSALRWDGNAGCAWRIKHTNKVKLADLIRERLERAAGLHGNYNPWGYYQGNGELKQALDMIGCGFFSPGAPERYRTVIEALTGGGDHHHHLLLADYVAYIACQEGADVRYTAQLFALFGFANLVLARRWLFAPGSQVAP